MYTTVHGIGFWSVWLNTNPLVSSAYIFQVDVKANSDLKHVKDSLAAEKKKKKTLLKSMDDVSNNCKLLKFSLLNWLRGSGE